MFSILASSVYYFGFRLLKIDQQNALRYARQILLPDVDIEGQEALLNSSALMIGAGGLGSACASYLISSGLGQLTLVDDDSVELSNLHRQLLHTEQDIHLNKAQSASQALQLINPHSHIHPIPRRLGDTELQEQIKHHTIVVDCSDNLATRNQLNQLCWQTNTPLISGAAIRFEGQIATFIPGPETACYACLSSLFGEQDLSCMEAGVIPPIVGIIGAMQALESIKVIMNIGKPISGRLLMFDGKLGKWNDFAIPKLAHCPVCANIK